MEGLDLKIFNKFFNDHHERFIRFANSYVRDLAVAEDFTLEAMMYYWENRHNLADNSNIPAYILTIIKHKCLNHLQHLEIKQDVNEQIKNHAQWELNTRISTLDACNPEELFNNEAHDIIRKTLDSLPEQSRRVFTMSRFENKSHKEIAQILGITTKGVEYHISKTLKQLYLNLKDYINLLLFLC